MHPGPGRRKLLIDARCARARRPLAMRCAPGR